MTESKDRNFEDLVRRIKNLENQVGNLRSSNMFGRSYSQVGSSSSDFLIKTKGQVKIQWGNKFIDLVKDGKINADSKLIYIKDEVESKDGIYVSTNGQSIILKAGDFQIPLGETGATYVSFLGKQNTTNEQKHQALTNIGFLYSSVDDIDSDSLQNGIIYIEDSQKLYIVQDGTLTEYTIQLPNPFTEQFIIAKQDNSTGALIIKGQGRNNSLAFDNLYIYTEKENSYLSSDGNFIFSVQGNTILTIDSSTITSKGIILANRYESIDANSTYGFRLYIQQGQSTLEVDNIIVRNGVSSVPNIYPNYWWTDLNIILSSQEVSSLTYNISLKYSSTLKIGDILFVYSDIVNDREITNSLVTLTVQSLDENSIQVVSDQQVDLANKLIFKLNNDLNIQQGKNGIDISIQNTTHTRIGDLSNLSLKRKNNGIEENISDTVGIFSQNGVFKVVQYAFDYSLPNNDNSSRLASTEWVTKFANNLLPVGSIIAFSGDTIPQNWALCDGTNGTPNLVGKFIKADSSTGEEGGKEEITIEIENLPSHTHTVTSGNITTSTNGEHSHTIQYGSGNPGVTEEGSDAFVGTGTTNTNESGSHSHTVNLSGLQLSNVGENKPIKWEPKYFSLMFIMKIK